MTRSDIGNYFIYHKPIKGQPERYEKIRRFGLTVADEIFKMCPDCHERDVAIDKMREAIMWANAAIACNEEMCIVCKGTGENGTQSCGGCDGTGRNH